MYHILQIKNRKYIYFPFSQSFFFYTEELEKKLIGNNVSNCDLNKVINNEIHIEKKVLEVLESYNQGEHTIGSCEINILHACNMNCRYCFASGGDHGKRGGMSKDNIEKIFEFIFQNTSKEKIGITIVGGEPFLDFKTFREVVQYGKFQSKLVGQKVYFSTISNGINIDNVISEFVQNERLNLIVSLDSNKKEINDYLRPTRSGISSFEYIMEHLLFLRDINGFNVNVTITPFNLNISEIARFLFDELNANNIHFGEVASDEAKMVFTDEQISKLMEEYDSLADIIIKKYKEGKYVRCYPLTPLDKIHKGIPTIKSCSALKNRCAFSPEGKIYPCDVMMYDEYCIGSIENGFDEKRISDLREINIDDTWCHNCWARYLCGGECLSIKVWKNYEQRALRCKLKKHICKLKLYIYENIAGTINNTEKLNRIFEYSAKE